MAVAPQRMESQPRNGRVQLAATRAGTRSGDERTQTFAFRQPFRMPAIADERESETRATSVDAVARLSL